MTAAILCGVLMVGPALMSAAQGNQPPDKTFTSSRWGIALDYPGNWSVDDDGEQVRFRSPQGDTIALALPSPANPSEPAPGRRAAKPACSTTTTAHKVSATVCVEPASHARRALLVLETRDGRQSRLALTTRSSDTRGFDALVASARSYP